MNITKEQFIELVIALEHRNLTIGLEGSAEWIDKEYDEVPPAIAERIEKLEKLQHEVYETASDHDMDDQFIMHEDTKLLVIKPDSDLERTIFNSMEEMEKAVAYEMVVRQKVIELAGRIRAEKVSGEPVSEELFPAIEEETKKYWKKLETDGLEGLIRDIE